MQNSTSSVHPTQLAVAHGGTVADTLERLVVRSDHGLASHVVDERREMFGRNALKEQTPRQPWLKFLDQFNSLLIIVLMAAAVLAATVGNLKDAAVILAVVLLNAMLGFFQEQRAEQSLAALRRMLPVRARVRRDGAVTNIEADQLVPGDIVLLEAGERVPADGRLILSAALAIDESSLTGESLPASKDADAVAELAAPLAERRNVAFMNTLVTRGRGEMVVTVIGPETVMGRISIELAATDEARSPLQQQLDVLGKRLGGLALTLVALLGFLEYLRSVDLAHALLDAIALAVAAVPEGLPVVVTLTLALGMRRMAEHCVIVKKLSSVETLGSTTVICSDKTGTLTLNQMTVRAFFFDGRRFTVTGEGYRTEGEIRSQGEVARAGDLEPLLIPLALCNDSELRDGAVVGDPMEGALLVLAAKGGIERAKLSRELPRIAEIPFDAAHKFMATLHGNGEEVDIFVKGAPDVLLTRCTRRYAPGNDAHLNNTDNAAIEAAYREFAGRGLRGLLVARRSVPAREITAAQDLHELVKDLTFVGLIGLMDPPRPEAKQAIDQARSAGIAVKMITGDHKDTALAIARELGIEGSALTGTELDAMDALDLADRIDDIAVFTRVAPEHKVKIVRALQSKGQVVAMTGDGVNDAPALKFADIGIAMGVTGTEVSKAAASMVLTDDNFASIVTAIRQGRALYDNIVKFIRFQLSTTIGAILTVFFAPLAGLPEPFTPLQILWVAMIMDGPPAVSLALDTARPGLMHEPPRPRDVPLLPFARLVKIIAFGITMMVGTLAILHFGLQTGSQDRALTLAFTTFILFQFFNVFNARVEEGSAFNRHFFDNQLLWLSLAGVVMLQILVVHWLPAQSLFKLSSLSPGDWAIAAAVASTVLLLEEARKLAVRTARQFGWLPSLT
ncbi:cation-translocating P-type ATPase [Bradyrhizobium sp.]|uniref:cation-translocating P-type ATPase n=1 Tax=Bradyrhizobium sp. TaxID=376 RepID=UPI003C74E2A4